MKIIERIKTARRLLRETSDQFAARFNKKRSTVNDWEAGRIHAPYNVIEFCESIIDNLRECPACDGTGVFYKKQSRYIIAIGNGMDDVPMYQGGTFTNVRKVGNFKLISGKPESFESNPDLLKEV